MIGTGAMLHFLGGGSEHSSEEYKDKVIQDIILSEECLQITFEDGKKIKIFDDGQSCCEHRYMRTDDDVKALVGKKLVHIATKEGPTTEIVFLEIMTSDGFITISNHNEHNGYYGGFGMKIEGL